jgi:NADH-quinone oxidoreductase subunit C
MEPSEIIERIKEKFPLDVMDVTSFRDQVSVVVRRERIVEICRYLYDSDDLRMDYLSWIILKESSDSRLCIIYSL